MINYIKQNVKLLILTLVALVLITINSASIIDNIKQPDINKSGISRRMVNPISFYDKDFQEITFTSENGRIINIPDNRNHIIIGINEQFEKDIETLYWYLKKFDMSNFDVDILTVSLEKDIKNSHGINVYNYDSVKLGEFFHLSDNRNFTIVLDKQNKIKFFQYEFLELRDLELLLKKFKKKDS